MTLTLIRDIQECILSAPEQFSLQEQPYQDEKGGITILKLTGELDHHTGARLTTYLACLEKDKQAKMILDLENTYVDSCGLGAILGCLKRVTAQDGKLVVLYPDTGPLRDKCRITGIEKVLPFYATFAEAVDAVTA